MSQFVLGSCCETKRYRPSRERPVMEKKPRGSSRIFSSLPEAVSQRRTRVVTKPLLLPMKTLLPSVAMTPYCSSSASLVGRVWVFCCLFASHKLLPLPLMLARETTALCVADEKIPFV